MGKEKDEGHYLSRTKIIWPFPEKHIQDLDSTISKTPPKSEDGNKQTNKQNKQTNHI